MFSNPNTYSLVMSRKKLTLSVEERLTRRAKTIARERGTSVSRLVETFFSVLERSEGSLEVQKTPSGHDKSAEDSDASSPAGHEPSDWAQRWRGAFAAENETYPDHPSWEEKVLAEEIEKKHTP